MSSERPPFADGNLGKHSSALRLAIVMGGGWLSVRALHGRIPALFAIIAASALVFGTVNAVAVKLGAWRR